MAVPVPLATDEEDQLREMRAEVQRSRNEHQRAEHNARLARMALEASLDALRLVELRNAIRDVRLMQARLPPHDQILAEAMRTLVILLLVLCALYATLFY
jgi:hypothetical protein